MLNTLPALPQEIASNPKLIAKLEEELGAIERNRAVFPTLRIREVTRCILTQNEFPYERRAALYEASALILMRLLIERKDLRDDKWRPKEMIAIVNGLLSDLDRKSRVIVVLHLMLGLSPHEIGIVTEADDIREPLDRAMSLLEDRLRIGGFSMEKLNRGGIGPIGDVTRALEQVRQKAIPFGTSLAAEYLAEKWGKLRSGADLVVKGLPTGQVTGADLAQSALEKIFEGKNPEKAPQNRVQLMRFVRTLINCAARDAARTSADYVPLDENQHGVRPPSYEGEETRTELLEAISEAWERINRRDKLDPAAVRERLADQLFQILVGFQTHPLYEDRRLRVLSLKMESKKLEEITAVLNISRAAVNRDWKYIRETLRNALATG